jgi:DNA polymerase-3 subunit epsilon
VKFLEKETTEMYAIIDLETTGGKFDAESITDIAIIKYNGNKVLDKFYSLINPEKKIDSFVEKLTGINNNMLKNAPKFYNIAKRIINLTEDCIIVAHNVSFDYRVLKTEFRRLGYNYKRKTLCTIKLSKKLIPNKTSYSLEKLVKILGIPIKRNHRAFDDANATFNLFKLLEDHDLNKKILKKEIKNSDLNSISESILKSIDKIPSETGLYYFYNEKKIVIFIGSSSNLKKKVLNHFLKNNIKEKSFIKEIIKITFSLTGNQTIAVLKMKNEIKSLSPVYNKNKFLIKKNFRSFNNSLKYPFDNFLLIDNGRKIDEFSFLYIKNKIYIGYGFFELNHQIKDNVKINSRLINMSEDIEIKKFIINLIINKKFKKIIQLNY